MTLTDERPKPVVFIIGAGLSGLLLAILLDRADIPFRIFERASTVKPLGSVISIGPTILHVLDQLGLLEEMNKMSFPCPGITLFDGNMKKLGEVMTRREKDITGYESLVFSRPDFHEMMLRQVAPENISFNKKVLKVVEEADKTTIHCSDNTAYECDILVGADGAYSSVRQSMLKDMKEKGILPKSDGESLVAGYNCMVGVTSNLDPEKYPVLKDDNNCHFESIIGSERHTWSVIAVPGRRVCWTLIVQFENPEMAKRQQFKNSEWGPEANAPMIKEFYDFRCPYGGIVGDLIDATPPELISKVYLEHKLFKSWSHGRSVLIGDACHKLLPALGQGAVNALQDATILANCLYDLEDNSKKSITAAFQSYYKQRFDLAKEAYDMSEVAAKVINGQKWHDRLVRNILFNYLPDWVQQYSHEKRFLYRPQATFLPMVPFKGTGRVLPQLPSKRYTREQEEKKKKEMQQQEVPEVGKAVVV